MAARKRVVEVTRRRSAPKLDGIRVLVLHDDDPDTSFLDQDELEDRKEEYERGDFSFVGVRAEADVVVEGVLQTLTSGGLWGIESDSGKEYVEETGAEQWNELRQILKSIGVATSELPTEFNPKWIEWRA